MISDDTILYIKIIPLNTCAGRILYDSFSNSNVSIHYLSKNYIFFIGIKIKYLLKIITLPQVTQCKDPYFSFNLKIGSMVNTK